MGKSDKPPLMGFKPSGPLRGLNFLNPGPESLTDFFPSPNYQGISTNYVFLEASICI